MAIGGFYEGGFLILNPNHPEAIKYVSNYHTFIWGKPYQLGRITEYTRGKYSSHIIDEENHKVSWPLEWAIPVVQEATQEEMDQLIG